MTFTPRNRSAKIAPRLRTLLKIGGPSAVLAAAVLAFVAVVGGGSAGAAASPAPSAAATACDRAPWEAPVQGAPAFKAGDKGGDYLWHDKTGFHLRVTHATHSRVLYAGEITASAPVRLVPVKLEKGDYVRLSANHRTIVFGFANHGYVDGVNFHTDCARALVVSHLNRGNVHLPASEVYLGATKAHPRHIPFVVRRAKSSS
jgi:hypothetical protein